MRFVDDKFNEDDLINKISSLKTIRDIFFDFLKESIRNENFSVNFITQFFEEINNELKNSPTNKYCFEYYDFLIWESFIGTIALLLHYEKYDMIHDLISHTYFLKRPYDFYSQKQVCGFNSFRPHLEMLEDSCQQKLGTRYYSFMAKKLTEREKHPIFTKDNLSQADLILYQLSAIIPHQQGEWYNDLWFPTMYIYTKTSNCIWYHLKSMNFCQKVLPLFGVNTISGLKNCIYKTKSIKRLSFEGRFDAAPFISDFIKLEEIASVN